MLPYVETDKTDEDKSDGIVFAIFRDSSSAVTNVYIVIHTYALLLYRCFSK